MWSGGPVRPNVNKSGSTRIHTRALLADKEGNSPRWLYQYNEAAGTHKDEQEKDKNYTVSHVRQPLFWRYVIDGGGVFSGYDVTLAE